MKSGIKIGFSENQEDFEMLGRKWPGRGAFNIRGALLFTAVFIMSVFVMSQMAGAYQFFADSRKWQALPLPTIFVDKDDISQIDGRDIRPETLAAMATWNGTGTTFFDPANTPTSSFDFTGANYKIDWAIDGDGKLEVAWDRDNSIYAELGLYNSLTQTFTSGAIAVTFIFSGTTGISDAYVIVNRERLNTTGEDLQAILTHELGHVLGLLHSSVGVYVGGSNVLRLPNAQNLPTMNPRAVAADQRILKEDDIAGIKALYDPNSATYKALSGVVNRCDNETDTVSGANIRAIESANSLNQISRYTGADGSYAIRIRNGVDYIFVVEPLTQSWEKSERRQLGIYFPVDTDGFTAEYLSASSIEGSCKETIFPEDLTNSRQVRHISGTRDLSGVDFRVDRGVRLAMVIDTSGSMSTELEIHVRDALTRVVNDWEVTQNPFPTVALQTFVDSLQDLLVTTDPVTLKTAIGGLAGNGGFHCGEASNDALLAVAPMLGKGGVALLVTDEPGRPSGPSRETIIGAYRSQGAAIRTMLTGDCNGDITVETTTTTNMTTLQAAGAAPPGEESPLGVASTDPDLSAASPLGVESPTATFSTLAVETGGSFLAINTFGASIYKQAIMDAANSAVRPTVAVVTPWRSHVDSAGGTVIDVEIIGANTNFNNTSMISFDVPDIIVNSLTIESPRRIVANLTSQTGFIASKFSVTTSLGGGETEITAPATFKNFYRFPASVPTITTLAPNRMAQGETGDVTVRGVLTNFVDGISTADFRPGATVNLFRVLDPVTAIANITVDPAASVGLHAVTVTTGAEVATNPEITAFQITPPPAAVPRLVSVVPDSLLRGQTADLTITGLNTGFIDQTSFLDLVGSGVTVNSLTVTSPTQATANVTVALAAPLGYLDAVVVTGGEDAAGIDAFTVVP